MKYAGLTLLLHDLLRARSEQDRKQEKKKNEMVGEASFTIASDDPLRKMLMLVSTTMSSAGLEEGFQQRHKNDDTKVEAETVPWPFGAPRVT